MLVRVYLAEGNPSEALRCYERYRTRLGNELGLAPSAQMQALVADLIR